MPENTSLFTAMHSARATMSGCKWTLLFGAIFFGVLGGIGKLIMSLDVVPFFWGKAIVYGIGLLVMLVSFWWSCGYFLLLSNKETATLKASFRIIPSIAKLSLLFIWETGAWVLIVGVFILHYIQNDLMVVIRPMTIGTGAILFFLLGPSFFLAEPLLCMEKLSAYAALQRSKLLTSTQKQTAFLHFIFLASVTIGAFYFLFVTTAIVVGALLAGGFVFLLAFAEAFGKDAFTMLTKTMFTMVFLIELQIFHGYIVAYLFALTRALKEKKGA